MRSTRFDAEEILAQARDLRHKTAPHPITDAEFTRVKSAGRP
ncbi:MAG: hypothetical protein ACUVX9_01625 [Anaerolineae bacterium]